MYDPDQDPNPFLAFFRRNERVLALGWVILVGSVGLSVVIDPIRVRAMDAVQVLLDRWDGRWTERLREGNRLVSEGRFEEAVPYLERLDRLYPARNVRHARDRERELLLRLLAQSYEALDKRSQTIETYQRLIAFDPRNYRSYFALAEASHRLLSRASMAVEARDAYAEALRILPSHLPSVRGFIQYYLDRGEFIPVVEAYERYLDAVLVQYVQLRLGGQVIDLPVLVDGRPKDYEIALDVSKPVGDTLTVVTGGFAVSVSRIELQPAERAGVGGRLPPVLADVSHPGSIQLEPGEHGASPPLGGGGELRFPAEVGGTPLATLQLTMTVFKPMDRELWNAVEKSYENLLNEAGRDRAAERTVTFDSAEAADWVMENLPWSGRGIFESADAVQN